MSGKIVNFGRLEDESVDVVIYARFSSDRQNETSIEGQLRYCHEYCDRRNMRVVGEYIDRALTGTKDTRPEFQKMINDAQKKQFSYIIVWKLDRFARNRYDSVIYKKELKKSGVRVLSATEGVGESEDSVILEAMLEASAEVFSKRLSADIRRGIEACNLKCETSGGNALLGYDIIDKKHVLNKNEARIVRYIFESYAKGAAKSEIAKNLNSRGAKTKRGNPFKVNSFSTMLSNRKYLGYFVYGKGQNEIAGGCPQIIEQELFDKVQTRLNKNRRSGRHFSEKSVEYLLFSKVFCGHCGANMLGDMGTGRHGGRFYYYNCSQKKRFRNCNKKSEKKGFLEWYVVEQTVEYILSRIDYIAEGVVSAYDREFNNEYLKDLEKRIEKLDRELEKVTDKLIETNVKSVIIKLNERARELELQKSDLEVEHAQYKIAKDLRLNKEDIKKFLKGFVNGDPTDTAFQRKIINTFVSIVYIWDDKISIYYYIKDAKQTSYIDAAQDIEDIETELESKSLDIQKNKGTRGSDNNPSPPPKQESDQIWSLSSFIA